MIKATSIKAGSGSANFAKAFAPRFSYIIFDMDGTLVDTFRLITDSYNYAAAGFLDKSLSIKEVLSLPGRTLEDVLAKNVPAVHVDVVVERYHHFFEKNFRSHTRVFPGIRNLLATLNRKGVKLAIFTGAPGRAAQITLRKSGLADFFLRIVSADDINQPKPSPEGLRIAMDAIGAESDKTVYVGDDPDDILASRKAGITTAAALWGSRRIRELQTLRPDFVFRDPSDVHTLSSWSMIDLETPSRSSEEPNRSFVHETDEYRS